MPTGLYAGVFLSALFELAAIAASIATIFTGDAAGKFNIGHAHFPLNGFVAWAVLAAMLAITVGCRTGRQWARYAAVAFWILPIATLPIATWPDALAELAYGVGFAASVAIYLFRNDAVEAYFVRAAQARASEQTFVEKLPLT
jgi:hypothetical protein